MSLTTAIIAAFSPFILGDLIYTPPIGRILYTHWPAVLLVIVIVITVILIIKTGRKK